MNQRFLQTYNEDEHQRESDINKMSEAMENFDKIEDFEKVCKEIAENKISIYDTKYIFRSLSWEEMIQLISGNVIVNNNGMIGFSFSTEKQLALYVASYHQDIEDSFIVIFDTNIMLENFNFVEVYPDIQWLKDNPRISYNLTGYGIDNNVNYFKEKLFDEATDENDTYLIQFSTTHNDYECFQKLMGLNHGFILATLLGNCTANEVLLMGEYYFVKGMIKDIKTVNPKNLDRLYMYIQENQDKLNLEL
jgi:hypothetical protein